MFIAAGVRAASGKTDGAIAIFVAVFSVVMLLMAALVVDLGMTMSERRDAQKAADLAALAGGQELPNESAAIASAIDYLGRNGWDTDPEGNTLSTADLETQLTDGNTENGEVRTLNGNTRLEVIPPPQDVSFLFAPAANLLPGDGLSDSASVSARAVVEIRSLGGILPFALTADAPMSEMCIETGGSSSTGGPKPAMPPRLHHRPDHNGGPPSSTPTPTTSSPSPSPSTSSPSGGLCDSPSDGNFGAADVGRQDVGQPSRWLSYNIAKGLDHVPERYLGAAWDDPCRTGDPVGAQEDVSPYTQAFNCLGTDTGNNTDSMTDGLMDLPDSIPCNGRINSSSGTGCELIPEQFFTYVSSADYAAQTAESIDSGIVDDMRFGVVPVVEPDDLENGKKSWLIRNFVGAYITDVNDNKGDPITDGNSNDKILTTLVYLFPLTMIDSEGLINDQESYDFLGSGPRIPVLIE